MSFRPTCDDVFERLTRGPFPAEDSADMAVEAHLAACHECRQLAEALRPAVHLFHAANVELAQVREDLPVYRGELPEPRSPRATHVRRPGAPAAAWGWPMAAAALAGIVLGVLLGRGPTPETDFTARRSNWLAGPMFVAASSSPSQDWIESFNLPGACRSSSSPAAASHVADCCTQCHASDHAETPRVDFTRLLVACVACHQP